MNYTLIYHKKTVKDRENLKSANLLEKAIKSCESLSNNPIPSSSKQLYHNLKGLRSIRINLQHRLVYEVLEEEKVIKILSMWRHYEQ